MAGELATITNPEQFAQEVRQIYTIEELRADEMVKICHLGGGALQFAEVIFPSAPISGLQAERYEREPEGRGAHFDVYDPTLDEQYPYLGVFNLSGEAEVTVAALPKDLAEVYAQRFPEPNEAAYQARRDFSSIALNATDTEVFTGTLKPGSGLVIAQKSAGPHIIHNVVPKHASDPGEFIKLVKINGKPSTLEVVSKTKLQSLDLVVSEVLGFKTPVEEAADFDVGEELRRASELGGGRGVLERIRRPRRDDERSFRSPCNLD